MFSKDLLSPYITRFRPIYQQMSSAKLELCCKDLYVTVNFKTVYIDVLKKNISTPKFARLERRAESRADEARVETENQQNISANANIKAEKAPTDTQKATLETVEADNYVKEVNQSAKEAKVITLKTKKDLEKALAKFKVEVEQAKAILRIIIKQLKRQNFWTKTLSE